MKRGSPELTATLAQLADQHLRRVRRTVALDEDSDTRAGIRIDGRCLIDFSSNDYLGLARHPALATAMSDCARSAGTGSGASHMVTGHCVEHQRLEEQLADFTGRERALLFSTGYMANLAIITTLAGKGESVLLDRLSHASLIDAGLLSGARFKRYAHCDAAAAETELTTSAQPVSVVATDGVFSMDGDVAPLDALARASRSHGAWFVVDDAHGLGVMGANGRGSLEHFGLDSDDVPVLMGTLGKAFGTFGAFVAGASDLIELLLQKARSYIYTTALPPPVAAASRQALQIAQREPWRRERLASLTRRFRTAALRNGVPLPAAGPLTPIQPVMLGSSEMALTAQQELFEAGFCVVAIRPPTVPRGTARLRVTLSAAHTDEQVDALADALGSVCARLGAIGAATPAAICP
ncbi:MAG TPA: 8-amino-7-oxononanoate synthase [Steroidobacteraceae bacterium]|nr:8-amino-7-oxononanoate synthase [Steroidobacteraceae bacterium]